MDRLLAEVQTLLVDFPSEQQSLERALDLARRAGSTTEELSPNAHDAIRASLQRLADLLTPPRTFCIDDEDLDAHARLAKDGFRRRAEALLHLALPLVNQITSTSEVPGQSDIALRARVLLACGRFVHVDISAGVSGAATSEIATSIVDRLLRHPPQARLPLLRHLLSTSLPLHFKPHPKLNPATGRVLSRPLGGDRGVTDWYEESEDDTLSWRKQAGLGSVVKIVVEVLEPSEVEDLWPFLLPPLLAFLDDYEAANKLVGISILDALLDKADASLLRRTGVGRVFEKSLENAFSSLSDPLSPSLLAAAHPVAFKLLNVRYPPSPRADDRPRFDAICELLTASITHAWEFKSGHVALETVTARALPPLLDALGAGSIRYLQLLVPHLCDVLCSTNGTWSPETAELLVAAAKALRCVVVNGRARVPRWAGRIGAAVAQCWVEAREDEAAVKLRKDADENALPDELEAALRAAMRELERVDGTVAGRWSRVEQDSTLAGLFPPVVAAR